MYLAKMTTAQAKEAFEKDPIIVIPVGSTEQHGTQGALGTDFMVPSYLADHVEDVDNVIVAPTVPYGVCPLSSILSLIIVSTTCSNVISIPPVLYVIMCNLA